MSDEDAKTLTDKIEAQAKDLQESETKIAGLEETAKDSAEAREKIHAELTDSLVGQFVAMRQVIDSETPKEGDELKELQEKLKLRSADSLRW